MKAVVFSSILALLIMFLFISPFAAAQNGEDDEEDNGEGCILATFCVITIFIIFLIYLSSKKKSEEAKEEKARRQYQPPIPRPGYRYPAPHTTYPSKIRGPRQEPPRKEVKCDLCSSKNIRSFEGGYFKCNECRHVFYISEMHRSKRK